MRGTVEGLKTKKGADQTRPTFGFITGDEDGESYFFIPTALQVTNEKKFEDIRAGDSVEFTPIKHPKGPRAIEVKTL